MARTVQQYFSWIGAAKGVSFSGCANKSSKNLKVVSAWSGPFVVCEFVIKLKKGA